jgi:ribosomal-protein-alanine N-acetyltransferase
VLEDAIADIVSPRLRLRHLPLEVMEERAASDFDGSGWLYELRSGQLREDPAFAPWSLRDVLLTETGETVGHGGFHEAPLEGVAEIGYRIHTSWQGRGFATEVAEGMMAFGRANRATAFLLSIAPDNAASLAIAAKLGFTQIGEQMDEIDGLEWVFRLG